ncbi:MAG TPA: glycosyltransferase [Acidimicrobiales bacterium]|nr:glycosyltransferase [Acidimicrobiales bacterium]
MIDVAAITSGRSVPSRRFRVAQHVPALAGHGIRVRELVPRIEKYAPPPLADHAWAAPVVTSRVAKAAWAVPKLATRIPGVAATWSADLTWLQREMVPGFVTLEIVTKRPWVFDVDDAVWLGRAGAPAAIARLARGADVVMAGNEYLASWCEAQGATVRIVPTAVDTDRYRATTRVPADDRPLVIGWMGTSANFRYLERIASPLSSFLRSSPAELFVVADRRPQLPGIPPERLRWQRWSAETEVEAIQAMDIGLMPLGTDEWSEGKCALKMLQYLACEVPALVSPTGMTEAILGGGDLGPSLRTAADWLAALEELRDDDALRRRRGEQGRRVVLGRFSRTTVAAEIASVFDEVIHGRR